MMAGDVSPLAMFNVGLPDIRSSTKPNLVLFSILWQMIKSHTCEEQPSRYIVYTCLTYYWEIDKHINKSVIHDNTLNTCICVVQQYN